MFEQDHRGIKLIIRPMMEFKSFECARKTLAGLELMRMIKKGQMQHFNGGRIVPGRTVLSVGCIKQSHAAYSWPCPKTLRQNHKS